MASQDIERLITLLAKLPGFGARSARRATLDLLKRKEALLLPLIDAMSTAEQNVKTCEKCGNLDVQSPCNICRDVRRDQSIVCVVEDVADLWALERTKSYRGQFHVLGGVLSALDGVGPEDLSVAGLLVRAEAPEVEEVILATSATVDGQTTAHYIADRLSGASVVVSGLAHGVPIGGELDYLDDGTLSAALKDRKAVL